MSTLDELISYCNEEKHLGALLLTGEWGCGKTYLIEHDLAEALRDTHFIVRVSFLGIGSVEALNSAVKKQYLLVCTPFLGRLKQEREQRSNIITAVNKVLSSLSPLGGNIASAVGAVDPLDYVPIEPYVEDLHDKGIRKRVVLVFDDLNRSQLDWGRFMGAINGYCEDKGITTIVIANTDAFKYSPNFDVMLYKLVKEKTVARTVRYLPDHESVIHSILKYSTWLSPEYTAFLTENAREIHDVFVGDAPDRKSRLKKNHNIHSLRCALREFYRLYEVLTELQSPLLRPYLLSFIVYMIVSRNGIIKDGRPSFDNTDEELKALYPAYRPELMSDDLRLWVEDGVWEKERMLEQLSAVEHASADNTEGAVAP